jgi:hypothetical protein
MGRRTVRSRRARPGEPLELYGTELNGGQIPEIDAFCCEHGLPFRRWSGGCLGAFLPEIVLFEGSGPMRDYTASEDEYVLFPAVMDQGASPGCAISSARWPALS